MDRLEVEAALVDEEQVLEHVARLLEASTRVEDWPAQYRRAFDLALDDTDASRAEGWKIVAVRRHLFGADASRHSPAPSASDATDRRRAERLRDGLPARVRFRAGRYLIPSARANDRR